MVGETWWQGTKCWHQWHSLYADANDKQPDDNKGDDGFGAGWPNSDGWRPGFGEGDLSDKYGSNDEDRREIKTSHDIQEAEALEFLGSNPQKEMTICLFVKNAGSSQSCT